MVPPGSAKKANRRLNATPLVLPINLILKNIWHRLILGTEILDKIHMETFVEETLHRTGYQATR